MPRTKRRILLAKHTHTRTQVVPTFTNIVPILGLTPALVQLLATKAGGERDINEMGLSVTILER